MDKKELKRIDEIVAKYGHGNVKEFLLDKYYRRTFEMLTVCSILETTPKQFEWFMRLYEFPIRGQDQLLISSSLQLEEGGETA